MNVLVAYATADGSTRDIAERIAAVMSGRGINIDARPIGPDLDLARYDAFVLGSAIHGGAWLPAAVELVESRLETLASRPVWLFSVSSIGVDSGAFPGLVRRAMLRALKEPKGVAPYWSRLQPRDHHWFAGVVTREQWGRYGDFFMKLFLGRYGDHRNWPEIDAWAQGIATALAEVPAAAAR